MERSEEYKAKDRARAKAWRLANPDKIKARKRNPDYREKERFWDRERRRRKKQFAAYIVRVIATGAVCYVGATTRPIAVRWQEHRRQEQCASLRRAISHYGYDNLEAVHVASSWDAKSLSALEILLIAQYDTLEPNGFNSTTGGKKSFVMSQQTRVRMSLSKKGIAPLPAIEALRRKREMAQKERDF